MLLINEARKSSGEEIDLSWFRFFLCLPAWRILSSHPVIGKILWCLLLSLPEVLDVLLVVVVVFYTWSVVGVWIFWETFTLLSYTGEDLGVACDSVRKSFAMHFELLIGNDWHEIMHGAVRMEGTLVACYFCAFIAVFKVLMISLLTGVIIDTFLTALNNDKPTKRTLKLDRLREHGRLLKDAMRKWTIRDQLLEKIQGQNRNQKEEAASSDTEGMDD